jgi:hypothetical protein
MTTVLKHWMSWITFFITARSLPVLSWKPLVLWALRKNQDQPSFFDSDFFFPKQKTEAAVVYEFKYWQNTGSNTVPKDEYLNKMKPLTKKTALTVLIIVLQLSLKLGSYFKKNLPYIFTPLYYQMQKRFYKTGKGNNQLPEINSWHFTFSELKKLMQARNK